MRMLVEDDFEVMRQTGGTPEPGERAKADANPAGDAAFIDNYNKNIGVFIDRYGPNGTFFKENPNLAHRPIRYLEIWTEPNFAPYLILPDKRPELQQEGDREALYAKLLPSAYSAIKARNKDVTVVGFGGGGVSAADLRFIDHVHKLNPKVHRSYDILSTHPYAHFAPPECYCKEFWGSSSVGSSLEMIRRTMEFNGRAEAPVWYTECGWEVLNDGGAYKKCYSEKDAVTPKLQAAYICRMYAYSLRLGVDHTMIFFTTDTDGWNAGFFRHDGSWRLSAFAVQNMIRQMPEPRLIGTVSDGKDGYFAYRFSPNADPNASPIIMAWNVTGLKVVHIPAEASTATIVDMVGNSRTVKSEKGKIEVEIGPLPIYLRFETKANPVH